MTLDYNALNLRVLDLKTAQLPELFINTSGITFSKRLLELMKYPEHVQFGIDDLHLVFSIRACRACDSSSFIFIKGGVRPSNTLSITNKNLHDILITLIPGGDPSVRYKLIGEYDSPHRTMLFNLSQAVPAELTVKTGK